MSEDNEALEITTFQSRECYVYAPLPPVTSLGHKADTWNVEKWLKAVRLAVVKADDDLLIRLLDQDTGDLFAECPVPNDIPIATSVEPVTDSSRYFVLKAVDRATKNHAFIGIGFRDRSEATDFCAALDDHRHYLRRRKEAEQMKEEFEQKEVEQGPSQDLALKGSIKLNLSSSLKKKTSSSGDSGFKSLLTSTSGDSAGILKLVPPPSSTLFPLAPPPSTTAGMHKPSGDTGVASTPAAVGGAEGVDDDDDWGDFASA